MEFPGDRRRFGFGASKLDVERDLKESTTAQQELAQQNFHDEVHYEIEGLTGLNTRKVFERELSKTLKIISGEIVEKRAPTKELSIILIDIDHFKKVNDTLGHPAGDAVLQKVSEIIKQSVRESDTVALGWGRTCGADARRKHGSRRSLGGDHPGKD